MVDKIQIFEPQYKSGVLIATVTTTASTVPLRAFNQGNEQVVITNTSTFPIYIAIGDSTVVATANDYLLPPNFFKEVLSIKNEHTHISAVTTTGSGSIHAILGNGFN